MIDVHSHILPWIDDGSRSLEESMEMLRQEAEQGIQRVVATPHFYAHCTNEIACTTVNIYHKILHKRYNQNLVILYNQNPVINIRQINQKYNKTLVIIPIDKNYE